jgi:hypothetical protein
MMPDENAVDVAVTWPIQPVTKEDLCGLAIYEDHFAGPKGGV